MKKYKSLLALLLVAVMAAALLSGCGPSIQYEDSPAPSQSSANNSSTPDNSGAPDASAPADNSLSYAPGTELRMATGYNNAKTGITFDAETAGEGVTLADGVTYHTGELKPTWVEVQNKLNVVFKNVYQGNSASKEFDFWKERLGDVDMVSGTAIQLTENGEGEFTASASKSLAAAAYQPYMPTSGKVEVDVVKADGSGTEKVTKDYDAGGNIVDKMNAAGTLDGVDAVNMLRTYIDETYGGYYGTNRADLYVGQNAAWDADELVALLRCVVANPQALNGTDSVQGLFTREDNNNQRRVDMFRFAGTLFGVRGLESRQDYLYVGSDNQMHDARQEAVTYEAMERMHAMAEEGLISKAFMDSSEESSKTYLENDLGFMHYDYNQTQTIMNATALQDGEKYMAAMVPVARWYDGTSDEGVYMRFTESWRSVKTDGWGISKSGVGSSTDKLNACLALIDFAYSDEGQILMSYGPEAFRGTGTFTFNGKEMPVIADATRDELWDKANGNYTNYARFYLGSTLSFLKSQAFEYQCTHEVGQQGAGYISTAIGLGTIKHPELSMASNPWYTIVPTVLPTTTVENSTISGYTELTDRFNQQKDGGNLLLEIIVSGYTDTAMRDAASTADTVANTWSGRQYLAIKEGAWEKDIAYYETLK